MAKGNQTISAEGDPRASQPPQPNPALKRLERLVGTWDIKGRTFKASEDNISGWVAIEWLPGGFFLQLCGELTFKGSTIYSLELIGYDPSAKAFSSYGYSSMGETPSRYEWDVRGDTVMHWTAGSRYTGQFSADGNTLSGSWRPDEGEPETEGNSYEAIMIRVK